MKIDEAKGKMCPYALIAYFMPGNIRGETPCNSRCQANECMMWRWHLEETPNEEQNRNSKRVSFLMPYFRLSTTDGYCGLVGKEGAE